MRYWDSSALVPLLIAEPASERVRGWLEKDASIVTWVWTRVEIAGAIERRARDGALTRALRREALDRLEAFSASWDEVTDVLAVRSRALAILRRQPVRAADAAQLGAALLVAEPEFARLPFACLDEGLAAAAEREGLTVLV